MTKEQAKRFARIYVGQLFYDHDFDRSRIDCLPAEKDLIESEINALLCKLLGNHGCMTPQDIYDLIMTYDSL